MCKLDKDYLKTKKMLLNVDNMKYEQLNLLLTEFTINVKRIPNVYFLGNCVSSILLPSIIKREFLRLDTNNQCISEPIYCFFHTFLS